MDLVVTDSGLLRRYAEAKDEAAFAALVRENIALVYSAALRRAGDRQMAEDVSQAVFMILARKAKSVRRDTPLSAWLLTTVKFAAANAIKLEARRRRREQLAAQARSAGACSADPSEVLVWQEIAASVDDAVLKLPRLDRRVVLLRYFEEWPIHDIAADLNTSEGAVKQRLARALEKLRRRLDRAGGYAGAISVEQFGQMLLSHAAAPAPAGLAGSVCAAAIHGGVTATSGSLIAKGAMHMMNWTKAKIVASVATAILIGATGGIVALNRAAADDKPAQPADANSAPDTGADKPVVSLASAPPVVIRSVPVAGTNIVDPALTEIKVTYSKTMHDGSWSWSTWGEDTFPETTGKPHYLDDHRTCVLPVKLKPGKTYAIWLNSGNFGNFKDNENRPAVPYLLVFKTRGG